MVSSYQNTSVRMVAPASTPTPRSFGDSHQCGVARDALVDVGHAVDQALQLLDRLGLGRRSDTTTVTIASTTNAEPAPHIDSSRSEPKWIQPAL